MGVLALLAGAKGGATRRRIGALEIHELACTATVAGRRLELVRLEFELLRLLAAEPRACTRSGSCFGTSGGVFSVRDNRLAVTRRRFKSRQPVPLGDTSGVTGGHDGLKLPDRQPRASAFA